MAATDPEIALAHWRAVREHLYREHPQSPVPAAERAAFAARHFDHDPASASRSPSSRRRRRRPGAFALALPNSGADTLVVQPRRDGDAATPRGTEAAVGLLDGRLRRRPVHPVPRRDQRHRDLRRRPLPRRCRQEPDLGGDPATGTLVLDFNFAIQPSCAFDPRWACPLAPPENRLDLPIRAGERLA